MEKKGQSSVEFIIVFGFSISFFIIFLSLGINFTLGYLVHYAVYDTSRIYLVSDSGAQVVREAENYRAGSTGSNLGNAIAYGETTWDQILRSGFFKIKNSSGFRINSPEDFESSKIAAYEFVGVYYRYSRRLSDSGFVVGKQNVDYVSESFLGKEPVRSECLERICERMNGNCDSDIEVTAFDNGC